MTNSTFHNLPLFDMVCMLALLFMAFMLLRAEETQNTTMPVVTALVKEDSTNFSILKYQINELLERLAPLRNGNSNEAMDFDGNKRALDAFLANPHFQRARIDTTLDIFMRLDTLMHTRKQTGGIIHDLVAQRDTLLHQYIRETQIERRTFEEGVLQFPIDEDVPFAVHPSTKRRLEDIMDNTIYTTVDSFITKYNVIKVIGHTDITGTALHNRVLSQKRADYLAHEIQKYIDGKYGTERPYLVQAIGCGEFAPLVKKRRESKEDWWQRCRRVELVFSTLQRF